MTFLRILGQEASFVWMFAGPVLGVLLGMWLSEIYLRRALVKLAVLLRNEEARISFLARALKESDELTRFEAARECEEAHKSLTVLADRITRQVGEKAVTAEFDRIHQEMEADCGF